MPPPNPLTLSRKALRLVIVLNLLTGLGITLLLVATLVAAAPVFHALGIPFAHLNSRLFLGMRLIMVIGICAIPIVHFILTRLLQIVDTVSTGNPFVTENAARLQSIAWALLALELLHLTTGAIAAAVSSAGVPLNIGWGFSITRCLAVLLLFVLARVFQEGATMREELAGTV